MVEAQELNRVELPAKDEPWRKQLLKPRKGWAKGVHLLDRESAYALNAALVAERPLLVRGEPGVGKSQLARAAADALDRALVTFTVNSRTETDDLLWQVDLVARLAAAQLAAVTRDQSKMALGNYVKPGPLWWGFDWTDAQARWDTYHRTVSGAGDGSMPKVPPPDEPGANGVVVLIDEIDKADSSVPNGLLDALGHRGFDPQGCKRVCMQSPAPLVVFTTNEERHLPDAFLRRCFVHTIELPKDAAALQNIFIQRGEAHNAREALNLPKAAIRKAAALISQDRLVGGGEERYRPGVAEFLDLLRAVKGHPDPAAFVTTLSRYVLDKQAARS